jgi:hypothetical protein
MRSRDEKVVFLSRRVTSTMGRRRIGARISTNSDSRPFNDTTYTRTSTIVTAPWTKSARRVPKADWMSSTSERRRASRSPVVERE